MNMYKSLTRCLCCDSNSLFQVLDLNKQPLANSYLKTQDEHELLFPLAINFCPACTHVQLTHAVDPDLLFKNYLYVSGTTSTLKQYFHDFVSFTSRYTSGKKVLDIACNDGTQLDAYKEHGYETYGIDPAENLFPLSSKNHNIICDYFTEDSIKKFQNLNEKFDIIIAQNVFAHNSYPKQFLDLCSILLSKHGCLFIQTSQADMIACHQFDTIYHEHISFFSVKSMQHLVRRTDFYIKDVIKTPIHGNSYVFVLSKRGPEQVNLIEKDITPYMMARYGMYCNGIAKKTRELVLDCQKKSIKVVGYGAAAKGNTFLNFSEIKLDYIVDDNSLKHYLWTPGSRIPILPPSELSKEKEPFFVLPLAWNFLEEIKIKVKQIALVSVKYIKYFPDVEIIDA